MRLCDDCPAPAEWVADFSGRPGHYCGACAAQAEPGTPWEPIHDPDAARDALAAELDAMMTRCKRTETALSREIVVRKPRACPVCGAMLERGMVAVTTSAGSGRKWFSVTTCARGACIPSYSGVVAPLSAVSRARLEAGDVAPF